MSQCGQSLKNPSGPPLQIISCYIPLFKYSSIYAVIAFIFGSSNSFHKLRELSVFGDMALLDVCEYLVLHRIQCSDGPFLVGRYGGLELTANNVANWNTACKQFKLDLRNRFRESPIINAFEVYIVVTEDGSEE